MSPTRGAEIKKTRPAVIISPDEMNNTLKTVVIAPLTSTIRDFPFRVDCAFQRKAINAFIFEWEREHAERLALDAKAAGLREGEEKGIKEGLIEGEEKKALEIAKAMKQKGIDLSTIKDVSGYPSLKLKNF